MSVSSQPKLVTPATLLNQPAPQFTTDAVVNGEIKKISLDQYKGKYVVLLFYPLDFTFVCPTEIVAFNKSYGQFQRINTEVLAISVDSEFCHLGWTNTPLTEGGIGKVNLPLLADTTHKISEAYGVLMEDGVAYRGLFLLDPTQTIRQITINDLPIGRSVGETLRLVRAYQENAKHGEVCPAEWDEGKQTMTPTQDGLKKFLKASMQ